MIDFHTFTKNCQRMWEIWANLLLPMALKTCPKSNKSPNLVTLVIINVIITFLKAPLPPKCCYGVANDLGPSLLPSGGLPTEIGSI